MSMKTKLSRCLPFKWITTGLRPVTTVLFIIIILALRPAPFALSQIPQGFNYQAIARDGTTGEPIAGPLNVKIAILSSINPSDVVIWEELHSGVPTDSHGLFSIVVGQGTWQFGLASFDLIDWTVTPKFIRTTINGTVIGRAKLWSVPYAMVADSLGGPLKKLEVAATASSVYTDPLFEVRNNLGKSVFAVYNDGVSIHVDKRTKGVKGGFSVGGFEAGGKDLPGQKYLFVDPSGVNVYIDDNSTSKDAKGGFSVGGFDAGKGSANYLAVNYDYSSTISTPVNRILWYPQKNAFLTGNIKILSPADVGENSLASGFQAMAKGNYSQAMGYLTQAIGEKSTAIGNEAKANMASSFAFGDQATASGTGSYAFGSVGRDTATFLPNTQPTTASGDYAFAIGMGAVAQGKSSTALGINSISIGDASTALGVGARAEGPKSTALGAGQALGLYSFAAGFMSKAEGDYSIAIGRGITKHGGVWNHASGYNSIALGYARAYGTSSVAIESATVNSDYGVGIGNSVTVDGVYATAIGSVLHADSYNSFVVGKDNEIFGTTDSWVDTDPLFVIGNGNGVTHKNAMTVLKNGNVGIGITSPTYPFEISKLILADYVAKFTNEGADVNSHGIIIYAGSASPTGLGAKFISFQHPAKVVPEIGSIQQNGSSSVLYNTSSDIRIKTKIIDTHFGIKDLMQVKVRDFEFKADPIGTANTGFIAQELFDIYPYAVTKPLDPNELWQIDYGRITPLIVKAVQDQQVEIESLKEKVTQLETLVQQLIDEK